MHKFLLLISAMLLLSCGEESLPKPKGYLSLEYPEKGYNKLNKTRPYRFDIAKNATVKTLPQNWLKIQYPKLKASVDITYRPVNDNLKELLVEAEKLVLEHTVKADHISWRDYADTDKKIYGKMCEISGNAASQIQFHVTDSTSHFLKGSLFFYTKPNYDSILPAVEYIKKDMIHMLETLEWED
ncbi:gliding motility lipoprotein GldD [Tenacibaculum sp. HL-MS23]|uniref:gliding motility lipoprotein GldD n=1 Tax=Tenacibaculum TaxID=104267 RepID=UPI0023AEA519|nr:MULTISPECIES: gliding motility lipoprotein GldD [Tenacibaculum]WNW01097.1 gliding motility lipoprotein GldD [Tenacibaculum sp. HL-MS23]